MIGVVSRFLSCLRVMRLFLLGVKFVGFVKYLLKESAILLFVVLVWLLNFMERFGSVFVGFLLFRLLMVFQYVFWFLLWSQSLLIWSFQICCL